MIVGQQVATLKSVEEKNQGSMLVHSDAAGSILSAKNVIQGVITDELHKFKSDHLDPLSQKVQNLESSLQTSVLKDRDEDVVKVSFTLCFTI